METFWGRGRGKWGGNIKKKAMPLKTFGKDQRGWGPVQAIPEAKKRGPEIRPTTTHKTKKPPFPRKGLPTGKSAKQNALGGENKEIQRNRFTPNWGPLVRQGPQGGSRRT